MPDQKVVPEQIVFPDQAVLADQAATAAQQCCPAVSDLTLVLTVCDAMVAVWLVDTDASHEVKGSVQVAHEIGGFGEVPMRGEDVSA